MCYPTANDLELDYLRRLLACLVYELEDLEVGDLLDDNTVIRTLTYQAPTSVMKLVKYLHDHPENREGRETYTPFLLHSGGSQEPWPRSAT